MSDENKKKRDEELDRFWDIDALIPAKRAPHYPSDTETTEIVLNPIDPPLQSRSVRENQIPARAQNEQPIRHFIPPHTADEERRAPAPDEEYTPDNALIHTVRLFRWKTSYSYYEAFVRDAVKLYPIHGKPCQRAAFFSYVPQYTQMNRAQLEWYLWWRECVRNGEFIDTDYSYVLLYAYELINLSGKMDAAVGQNELFKIWTHYRALFRQLDTYLPDWICDYSLIHRLPSPKGMTGDLLSEAMAHCRLKEFYVPYSGDDAYVGALLAFCSNYDYHKSKFCVGESAALFDRAIPAVLRRVVDQMSEQGKLFSASGMEDSKLIRDSFTGALCSYRVKRKIEVEFTSFSRTHELRYFITDVIKYTENQLRSALGIRSRLSIYALPVSVRTLIDTVLGPILPKRASHSKGPTAPAEYEKQYDLPHNTLSLDHAAEIERLSWDTTEKLVEAFLEEEGETELTPPVSNPLPPPMPLEPAGERDDETALDAAMLPYLPLLRAVADCDVRAQDEFARELGKPLDVLADEVNTLAAEYMGDILLEEADRGYAVISDYRDLLEELIETNEKG